ncbi:uncharacterized protein LOC136097048 [Hydra vulgaris]|uniref:uncharacterized protein LOC136097048 n=1 Tax=Hydra vulgaris TaxID=6087 RepID=UPI0032EA5494
MAKNFTPAQLKEILENHENTMMKIFNDRIEKMEIKFNNLKDENFTLKKELSEVQKAVEFISKSYDKIIIELTELKKPESKKSPDKSNIENGTNNIKEKIAELEDRSRRNNLRFIGIKDKANETWEESEQKIKDFLITKLNIREKILIDRAHRVGKENGKNRSIIVRFQNYKDKALVLNKYTTMKLWNERLYVNEDLSDFTMDLRRKLFKEAKELRAKGFETILLERQTNKRGGGVLIYVKEHIAHNIRNDMRVSDGDKEIVTIEILNNKKNNILLSCCYRPPDGASENLSFFLLQNIIHKGSKENKITFIIGDFNMNCLIYNKDKKIKSFYDEILMAGAVPLINRPTRITKTSTTLIDNIFTTDIYNRKLKKGIIKTDISDHFPIFLTIHTVSSNNPERQNIIKKRVFNESNIKSFQYQLSLLH